jgi:WXG100 family type VII secretion target
MSDRLLVNFTALQAASQHISTAIGSLHSQLGDLESAAKPLVSTWHGNAQREYAVRQQQWTSAAQDLTRILTEIKRSLEESAQEYQATEQANANLFR